MKPFFKDLRFIFHSTIDMILLIISFLMLTLPCLVMASGPTGARKEYISSYKTPAVAQMRKYKTRNTNLFGIKEAKGIWEKRNYFRDKYHFG
jgi:ATP-dependent Zn protease